MQVLAVSARDQQPAAPVKTAQELADYHDLCIHLAMQRMHMVGYKGLNRFVVGFCHHKGDREMVVYLNGATESVRPSEITILEQPK